MNRDYVDEQITAIVDQLGDVWTKVHSFIVELETHGHDDACIDLNLHEIKRALNLIAFKLWKDKRQTVLDRYFPIELDPDRLREDAEDCARPVDGPEA